MPYRQQQEHQEHQEYLIANPMSPEAYKYREQLWYEFFKPKGKDNERLQKTATSAD